MQILLNLGLNDRDALEVDTKEIQLSFSVENKMPDEAVIKIGRAPDSPFALFTVRDTGTGMSEAVRQHL